MGFKYIISGICVQSDLFLEDIVEPTETAEIHPEVTIETFDTTHSDAPEQTVSKNGFSFSAVEGLSFTISGGNRIAIFKNYRITDAETKLFLLGSAWGVLCHQRGLFPLHCSAVSCDSSTYAFVADSGGGKSTLAASLCAPSLRHVCDDVAIAQSEGTEGIKIYAMPKGLKLWQEASAALGMQRRDIAFSENGRDKHYIEPPMGPETAQLDLRGIYEIQFGDAGTDAQITRLTGAEALKTVYRNIYKVEWLDLLGISDRALAQAGKIAAQVPVYRFTRPRALDRIVESSSVLAAHIRASEAGSS